MELFIKLYCLVFHRTALNEKVKWDLLNTITAAALRFRAKGAKSVIEALLVLIFLIETQRKSLNGENDLLLKTCHSLVRF